MSILEAIGKYVAFVTVMLVLLVILFSMVGTWNVAAADLRRHEATCTYQSRTFKLGLPTVRGECYSVFGYRLCKI